MIKGIIFRNDSPKGYYKIYFRPSKLKHQAKFVHNGKRSPLWEVLPLVKQGISLRLLAAFENIR